MSTAWAFATATVGDKANGVLLSMLTSALEQHVSDFDAQELTDVAWAFARMDRSDMLLFEAMAREAEQGICNFGARELAITAWAFAAAAQGHARPV